MRRGIPVPAVLAGQDHLDDVATELAELLDQFRERKEIDDAGGMATLDGGLVWRLLPPVWLADQHDAAWREATPQEVDSAGHTVADPGGADTCGDAHRPVRDVSRSIAVHEADLLGDTQLNSARPGGGDKHRTDVDPGARQAMVAGPGAEHLPGPAGQVEHLCSRRRAQRLPQSGQVFAGERVVDAMAALPDGKAARKIH